MAESVSNQGFARKKCYNGISRRCKKNLGKAEKLNMQMETSGKRAWKKLKIDSFSPISEKMLLVA